MCGFFPGKKREDLPYRVEKSGFLIGEINEWGLWRCYANICISSGLPTPTLQSLWSPAWFHFLPHHQSSWSFSPPQEPQQSLDSSPKLSGQLCLLGSQYLQKVQKSPWSRVNTIAVCTAAQKLDTYMWHQKHLPGDFSCADLVDGTCNCEDQKFHSPSLHLSMKLHHSTQSLVHNSVIAFVILHCHYLCQCLFPSFKKNTFKKFFLVYLRERERKKGERQKGRGRESQAVSMGSNAALNLTQKNEIMT